MKMTGLQKNKTGSFYLCGIVFILLTCFFLSGSSTEASIKEKIQETYKTAKEIPESMKGTYKSIEEFIDGVNNFVGKIQRVISMTGFKPIAFLIIVIFLSSGLSAIGVPRGMLSFFISLALVNTIWIIWKMSFGNTQMGEYLSIIKTNLILLFPFMLIFSIKSGWPFITKSLKNMKARLTGEELKLKRKEINSLSRLLLEENMKLHNQIQANIDNDELSTGLSSDTKKLINKMRKLLDLLEKKSESGFLGLKDEQDSKRKIL
jgi:uncharacterized protein YoxC